VVGETRESVRRALDAAGGNVSEAFYQLRGSGTDMEKVEQQAAEVFHLSSCKNMYMVLHSFTFLLLLLV
jgi:hypothetical protein